MDGKRVTEESGQGHSCNKSEDGDCKCYTHTHTQFKLLPDLKRINKILFFKLEYNCYPMLCYSVLYKRVSQLYTYIRIDSVPEGTKQFVGLTLS